MKHYLIKSVTPFLFVLVGLLWLQGCKPKGSQSAVSGNAASKVYVAPGKYDEFYNFVSGGFSGQMSVYGLPSGRLFRVIPVFSVDPEKDGVIVKKQNQC
jgi:nitrous-oxide reductase